MRGFKMILSVFVLAMVLAGGSAFANMNKMGDHDRDYDQGTYNQGFMNNDSTSNDPAVSVPNVQIAPNGDRVGQYPPYFFPGR